MKGLKDFSGENKQNEKSGIKLSENPNDVIWVNASKTGRGATIVLNGELYVTPIQSIERLAKGEVKGAKFTKIVR